MIIGVSTDHFWENLILHYIWPYLRSPILNIFLQYYLNSARCSLVIVVEKNITDRQPDRRMDRWIGQKHICLQPVRQRHNRREVYNVYNLWLISIPPECFGASFPNYISYKKSCITMLHLSIDSLSFTESFNFCCISHAITV